ncbi:MAG TPA: LysM domain-containing protein [Acidimicrobiales bacterium]
MTARRGPGHPDLVTPAERTTGSVRPGHPGLATPAERTTGTVRPGHRGFAVPGGPAGADDAAAGAEPAGWRGALRLALWTAALPVTARVLLAAGAASPGPPLRSPDRLAAWATRAAPADLAVAVLRLGALAAVGYLLAVTALAAAVRALRLHGAAAAAVHRATPAAVRRIVARGSGVGLVVGGVVGALPVPAPPPAPGAAATVAAPAPLVTGAPAGPAETATMWRLAGATATMTRDPAPDATGAGAPATGPPVDPGSPAATVAAAGTPGNGGAAAATATGTPAAPDRDPAIWLVEAGDSFWSIAAEVTSPPGGPPATEHTVRRYWRALVAANRDRLLDPANPDVLRPGQRLVLPPPPDG